MVKMGIYFIRCHRLEAFQDLKVIWCVDLFQKCGFTPKCIRKSNDQLWDLVKLRPLPKWRGLFMFGPPMAVPNGIEKRPMGNPPRNDCFEGYLKNLQGFPQQFQELSWLFPRQHECAPLWKGSPFAEATWWCSMLNWDYWPRHYMQLGSKIALSGVDSTPVKLWELWRFSPSNIREELKIR